MVKQEKQGGNDDATLLGKPAAFDGDTVGNEVYIADGTNQCVRILRRENLKEIRHFGRMGHYAGQFIWVYNVDVDSKDNLYTSEIYTGKRVQQFALSDK